MRKDDEKLTRLMADLRKAVIGLELNRGRSDYRPPAKAPRQRAA